MALSELLYAGAWLLAAATLVLDLAGVLHRGTGFRVQTAGVLVMVTAQLGYQLAHPHRLGILPLLVAFPVVFGGLALVVRGAAVSSRERRAGTRQPPRQ